MGSKNIWTSDGRIHVKLDDKLYIINKLSDLDDSKRGLFSACQPR